MNSEGSKAILTEKRPGSCRQRLGKGLTYRLLLGRNKPGLFLKLSTEGVDVALRLGSCLLLILRQGGMEPLILLPHLVGHRKVGQSDVCRDPSTPGEKGDSYRQMLVAGIA